MLICGKYTFSLERPLIMGIVNVTDDSFSGDGKTSIEEAIKHAFAQINAGADILDIGAESSRPGAKPISTELEWTRLQPILEALKTCHTPISIDTTKPEIMQRALQHGASMINDINAFRAKGALEVIQNSDCAACFMHMQGDPQTMQEQPNYQNIVKEVRDFLEDRANLAIAKGILKNRIVLDPGFGFGKTMAHNLELLAHLKSLQIEDFPLLIGISRKDTLGKITGKPKENRVIASVAAALIAVERGAKIVRVHDVDASKEALLILHAVNAAKTSNKRNSTAHVLSSEP